MAEQAPVSADEGKEGPAQPVKAAPVKAAPPSLLEAPPHETIGLPSAVQPILLQQSEVWGIPYGGFEQTIAYTGMARFGLRLDLDEAGWVQGMAVGAEALWVQGRNVSSDALGDIGIVSNFAGVQTIRLYKVWLKQRWLDDHLELELGQILIDDAFMVLDSALLFIHSGFGTAQTIALNFPAAIYPLPALGARLAYRPSEVWELQLAIYDGNAGRERENPHASDLALSVDQGAVTFSEVTWRSATEGKPLRFSLGGFVHLGLFEDYGRHQPQRGLGQAYLMVEQTLARWSGSALTAFTHISAAFPDRVALAQSYFDFGLVLAGGAWSRADDRLGLGLTWTDFGGAYLKQARFDGVAVSQRETVVELTYRLGLLPWTYLQPALQYVVDPHFSRNDALAIALRASVKL